MTRPDLRPAIALSIAAAVLTIGLKSVAYALTDSVGLLSDALESLLNLIAAVTAYFSLWYAARPEDRSHTYGHEKIEYFSSGLEGGLIIGAGFGIAYYAVRRLVAPVPLESLGVGALLGAVASAINLFVAVILLRAGKRHGSIVLEADGRHLMSDVWSTVAVLSGLGLVVLTGREWVDPVVALGVAANIAWTGFELVRRSFDGLMDHAWPEEETARLRGQIEGRLPAGTAYHALRTRKAGSRRFADFHFLVPGAMSVGEAHAKADEMESAVEAEWPGLELTIHIEPIEERASYDDRRWDKPEALTEKK
jgi:cation diffusion facilitator family transporter